MRHALCYPLCEGGRRVFGKKRAVASPRLRIALSGLPLELAAYFIGYPDADAIELTEVC